MKKEEKQSNSVQAIWISLGSLSSLGLSIVSAAVLSRYFDKADYGTYRQILYIYNTLLIIFTAGLPKVFSYYLPRYTLTQGRHIVSKLNRLLLFGGMIFSVFLFCFSDLIASLLKNPELAIGLKYFSPIPTLLLPTFGIEGLFSTYKKAVHIAIYNTITRTLMLFFIVMPVILFNGTYLHAIYGWIVVSALSLIISFWFKSIPFRKISSIKSDLTYREILSYSLPLIGASVAGIAIKAADQFYISRFFGSEIFAEFSNGFMEIPFVTMVTSATATVLMPIFSRQIHQKAEVADIVFLWNNAILKSAMIIYPMVVFFIFHAESIITLLYSSKYMSSVLYFKISMLLNFFNIIVFAPLLFAMGKTTYYASLHILFAILSWSMGYAVILMFGTPVAIAILSVSLGVIKILIFAKYSSQLLNITFLKMIPVKRILILVCYSLVIAWTIKTFTFYLFPHTNHLVSISVNFIGFSISFIFLSKWASLDYIGLLYPFFKKKPST